MGAVGASTEPSEWMDLGLLCEGVADAESGDLAGEKSADFGRPGASGPGDGEEFLTNGLLRTDMAGSWLEVNS